MAKVSNNYDETILSNKSLLCFVLLIDLYVE